MLVRQRSKQFDYVEFQPKRRIGQKSLDPYSPLIKEVMTRMHRTKYDSTQVPPHPYHSKDVLPAQSMKDTPISAATPKWVHTIYCIDPNPVRGEGRKRPLFSALCWTPDGRRLITGNSKGEFTLWHGTSLASEMRVQGHEDARVTCMLWSESSDFMISSDDKGQIKYHARNMHFLKAVDVAPNGPRVREVTTSPNSSKFAACSEDGIIRVFDTKTATLEKELLGHGGDVTTNHWHPTSNLFASGSQDKKVILWDPRSTDRISSLLGFKDPVTKVRWSPDDYMLLAASKDTFIRLFDIRMAKELFTFAGHKKDVMSVAWHPTHRNLFSSGGNDGQLSFWVVGQGQEETKGRTLCKSVCTVYKSHGELRYPNPVIDVAWHPLGHALATASWECKFWTHNKPGATEEVKGVDVSTVMPTFTEHSTTEDAHRPWNVWTQGDKSGPTNTWGAPKYRRQSTEGAPVSYAGKKRGMEEEPEVSVRTRPAYSRGDREDRPQWSGPGSSYTNASPGPAYTRSNVQRNMEPILAVDEGHPEMPTPDHMLGAPSGHPGPAPLPAMPPPGLPPPVLDYSSQPPGMYDMPMQAPPVPQGPPPMPMPAYDPTYMPQYDPTAAMHGAPPIPAPYPMQMPEPVPPVPEPQPEPEANVGDQVMEF
eukprot:TRINITY_DN14787_c0_g5_i1.p1 TRINITY_DN14787_c0_g5~~TRINITY_DN14787_c0_g5_i1.p1  ORF type:complete len:648 (+),score=130.01 TRINITY_DN14787_c0_g5_i1:102-2045(+)